MCHIINTTSICNACGRWLDGDSDVRRCREARARSRDADVTCQYGQCQVSEETNRLSWAYCLVCVEEYNEWLRLHGLL